ncbi:MAG: N-acetyltransferase [Caldicoprobacter sp.]|uniref:GNAT family N-acetyltransferase n=1 Tax=Caldicoprobacter sp. TaxID=2004500 RepID=UPI0039C41BA6
MDIKIRSERISDYNSIANINYAAFLGWRPDDQFISEHILASLLRHNSMFDPELSLVAEHDGRVVGHVLFSPFKFIVLGQEQLGVVLGPVAVMPEFQRKGIGSMLIEEGYRKAREKGFAFSLLCGHPNYYPRFGYKTGMFSLSGTKVNINVENFNGEGFMDRPVNEQDISWLVEAWKNQHGTDALALFPGDNITEWSNHGLKCRCSVVIKNDRILGYVRYVRSNILNIKELLAKDEDIPDILAYLASKEYSKAQGEMHVALPAEKLQISLGNSHNFEVVDRRTSSQAFMIKVLDQDSPIASYCERVEKGLLKPGIIVFPVMFDIDEGRTE